LCGDRAVISNDFTGMIHDSGISDFEAFGNSHQDSARASFFPIVAALDD